MKLGVALGRAGASLAKDLIFNADRTKCTLYLRVAEERGHIWVEAFTAFLLAAEKTKSWGVDVSKYYFTQNGSVRYLWRILITATAAENLDEALHGLGQQAIEAALRNAPRVDSFPLVGRAVYEYDPARGKLKGAYAREDSSMPRMLASAFHGG